MSNKKILDQLAAQIRRKWPALEAIRFTQDGVPRYQFAIKNNLGGLHWLETYAAPTDAEQILKEILDVQTLQLKKIDYNSKKIQTTH